MPEGLTEHSVVRLAPHVTLRFDAVRDAWTLLGPERVFSPSSSAVAVIRACDGRASIAEVAEKLAAEFDAPAAVILKDALGVLDALRAKGYLAEGAIS